MIRLILVDDHTVVRRGIKQILSLDSEMKVVGESANGWELLELLSKTICDCLVMDLNMPGPPYVELIKRLRRDHPDLPLVVLSMYSEVEIAERAIRAGAAGYVTKDSEPEILLQAIHKVENGGRYIVPSVAEKIVFTSVLQEKELPHKKLSDREFQVLELMLAGLGNKEIATRLNLSANTVSTYKTRVMKKLDAQSGMELMRYAIEHGLIQHKL